MTDTNLTSTSTAHRTKYPEHQRLKAVQAESNAVGDFIVWLRDNGMDILRWQEEKYICAECGEVPEDEVKRSRWLDPEDAEKGLYYHKWGECDEETVEYLPEGHYPIHKSIEQLLAEHFEIDLKKIDNEKRAMLDECRRLNQD